MSEENNNSKKRGYGPDDNYYSPTNSIDAILEAGSRERARQRTEKLKNTPILVIPTNIK